jgi:hypothetical protein
MKNKTVIVGGGMAGLSCGLKLLELDQDFILITDSVGGRIQYSAEAGVNFGAYFVMSSYTHAKQLLNKGSWINPTDSCFHNSPSDKFAFFSWHTLKLLPELVRFLLALIEFSSHYEQFKKRCLTISLKESLTADPYIAKLYSMPALTFVRERKFEKAGADYVSKFAYACTGANLEQITALDFLNVSMAMITPIHSIVFDPKAVSKKLESHIILDTITAIHPQDGEYLLTGESGQTYLADNIVVATPAIVAQTLLGLKEIRRASQIHVFHVKAELKPEYQKKSMNLFNYSSAIMLIVKQFDGSFLIYSREKEVDLKQVCRNFELLKSVSWEKAMYVQGSAYLEQEFKKNLFIAGDHNGLGLEPAAISGIFAANKIISKESEKHE